MHVASVNQRVAVTTVGAPVNCHGYQGTLPVILFHPAWRGDLVGGILYQNGVGILKQHALTISLRTLLSTLCSRTFYLRILFFFVSNCLFARTYTLLDFLFFFEFLLSLFCIKNDFLYKYATPLGFKT